MREETKTQEAQVTKEAQEKSFYDEALETVEKVLGVTGEYAGKVASLLRKPLNQIHKHTTEPFIEEFKKAFNDGK
jgi:hypothetical protein